MSNSRETAPDCELQDIVEHVFSKPPGEPKTIDLSLTAETADQFAGDEDRELMALEIFSQIAIKGAQRLFAEPGQPFSLLQMSRDQYARLQKYMNSMGVKLIITCNEDRADPWDLAEKEGMEAIKHLRLSIDFL